MALQLPLAEALQELWVYHQFFMRLGFDAGEIWVARVLDPMGTPCAGLHVQRGEEEFNLFVCEMSDSYMAALREAWPSFVREMNALPKADQDVAYFGSRAIGQCLPLVQGLLRKGGCFAAAVADVNRAERALRWGSA